MNMIMTRTSSVLAGIACAAIACPPLAHAGGLARPTPVSARGVGMGGAFSAIADDPTALHFNPAGIARLRKSHIMIGGEFVVAPRTYKPITDDCTADPSRAECREQSPTAPVRPLPSLGFTTRLSDNGIPSRLSFGVGLWNTFGGQLEYNECDTCGTTAMPDNQIPKTVQETRNAVIEVVPGIAYEVNDVLALGMAVRLGIGLFNLKAHKRPIDNSEFHTTGVGAGATFGIMITPNDKLSLGAYYRTPLTVETSGSGTNETLGDIDVNFTQRWPQEWGLGVAFKPTPKLVLAGQFDWHGWSVVEQISPVIVGQASLTDLSRTYTDWNDSYTLRAGLQYDINSKITGRAGFVYDTRAVTKRSMERQFLDSDKMLASVGASYQFLASWRVDLAFETTLPADPLVIEDNSAEVGTWTRLKNVSPGEHSGSLHTFEIALQYMY